MSTPANFNGARPVIDPDNAAMLLIDHQSGLFQTIGDMPFTRVRAHATALARVVQAGVVPMDTAAVASEIQRSWNRDDAQQWAEIYTKIFPNYQRLIESYLKAQDVQKNHEPLDSQRS
ncbi:hypothetical protein ABW45_14935 [Stenotrophomonas maltophilia]|nr:hypothetical protein [Stenotrophomonas pavanii]KOQ74772.1 hypothetical protein ABW45_14935 [Stenotrophomonas maltophilia]